MTISDVLRINVQLLDVDDPPVTRILDVPASLRLGQLHAVLQLALGWTDSHLHSFTTVDPYDFARRATASYWVDVTGYIAAKIEVDPTDHDENETSLGELIRSGPLFYQYDFGDNWNHKITLLPDQPGPLDDGEWARLIDGAGRCPVENVGGITGWEEFKDVFRTPSWRAQQPLRSWVETTPVAISTVKPDYVDLDLARRQLRLLAAPDLGEFSPGTLIHDMLDDTSHLTRADVLGQGCLTPDPVAGTDRSALLRPFRWLLERVGTGLKLTQAGWLPPAVVRDAVADLGLADHVWGKGDRENHTQPVALLRSEMTRLGLLRKSRGVLSATEAARRAAADDDALWRLLVQRTATRWPGDAARLAGGFMFLTLTSDRAFTRDEVQALALLGLLIHGYSASDGGLLTQFDAWYLVWDAWLMYQGLGLITEIRSWPATNTATAALREFATAVLLYDAQ